MSGTHKNSTNPEYVYDFMENLNLFLQTFQ